MTIEELKTLQEQVKAECEVGFTSKLEYVRAIARVEIAIQLAELNWNLRNLSDMLDHKRVR